MGLFKSNKDRYNQFATSNSQISKTLHKNLEFTATEQYKLIRTNWDFTLPENEKCPVIGVTSSMRGEGKSTTAVNLSYVFAEKGSKVLLIDGDLRIPSVAKKLEIESTPGLADLLRGKGAQISEFQSHLLPNWFVLPSGDIPPNPSELLGSSRMGKILDQLREIFDYIVVDLPPVTAVADPLVMSKLLDGIVVVVRHGYTRKKNVREAVRQLNFSGVRILGFVYNGFRHGSSRYYKRTGKYYRKNYYGYRERNGSSK